MSEQENRDRRRRAGGNGGKVKGGRESGQLSTVSMGQHSRGVGEEEAEDLSPDPIAPPPDPEVSARAVRRQFSARYKLKILEQVDSCTEPGEVGRLLRREGLYSSHLAAWRKAQRKGSLQALAPKKRGRKGAEKNPLSPKVQRLERKVTRLEEELRKAHLILDVQGKVAGLLGLDFGTEKSS